MNLHVVAGVPFFCSEDTRECGEKASPDVVIDVVICESGSCEERKSPGTWFDTPARAGVGEGRVR
jgi:hypothetical protein